jgi:hypothetical protein
MGHVPIKMWNATGREKEIICFLKGVFYSSWTDWPKVFAGFKRMYAGRNTNRHDIPVISENKSLLLGAALPRSPPGARVNRYFIIFYKLSHAIIFIVV